MVSVETLEKQLKLHRDFILSYLSLEIIADMSEALNQFKETGTTAVTWEEFSWLFIQEANELFIFENEMRKIWYKFCK